MMRPPFSLLMELHSRAMCAMPRETTPPDPSALPAEVMNRLVDEYDADPDRVGLSKADIARLKFQRWVEQQRGEPADDVRS